MGLCAGGACTGACVGGLGQDRALMLPLGRLQEQQWGSNGAHGCVGTLGMFLCPTDHSLGAGAGAASPAAEHGAGGLVLLLFVAGLDARPVSEL